MLIFMCIFCIWYMCFFLICVLLLGESILLFLPLSADRSWHLRQGELKIPHKLFKVSRLSVSQPKQMENTTPAMTCPRWTPFIPCLWLNVWQCEIWPLYWVYSIPAFTGDPFEMFTSRSAAKSVGSDGKWRTADQAGGLYSDPLCMLYHACCRCWDAVIVLLPDR